MSRDPAERALLALLGVVAGAASALCALSTALFQRGALGGVANGHASWAGIGGAVLVTTVALTGAALCCRELYRRLRATHALVRNLDQLRAEAPAHAIAAAERHGVADRLVWIDSEDPIALTVGLTSPHVVVSRGLFDALTDPEREAVLAHEAYHVRRRDPLRGLVAHAITAAVLYLPSMEHLRRNYETHAELSADRHALGHVGPAALATALACLLAPAPGPGAATAAMSGNGLLEARIQHLETREAPDPGTTWLTPTCAFVALTAAICAIVMLLGTPALAAQTAVDSAVHLALFAGAWALYRAACEPWLGRVRT